jgi:putative hemolysin
MSHPLPGSTIAPAQPISHSSGYSVRVAESTDDVRAAQALRFAVFNLELGHGLDKSHASGFDADVFDTVCDHLLAERTDTGETIGTYRLQTGRQAGAHLGYYCAQEFDLAPFEPFRDEVVELGRACIHRDHRSRGVLGLLWQAVSRHTRERRGRWLIGCSSLNSQDPAVGAAAFELLSRRHLAAPELRTRPWPALACPLDQVTPVAPKIPGLLAAYLALGAKICAPPVLDREFGTIDFLTVLDLAGLHPPRLGRFLRT